MSVTVYHNPACGTSRNVLALIRNAGIEPQVIEYLKTPPSRDELRSLAARMGVPLRAVLRRKGTPYDALGLDDPSLTEGDLLDAIGRNPILVNRPLVVTPRGVKLCRPSEVVLDLLDQPQQSAFVKEDGEPVVVARPLAAYELGELEAALSAAGLPAADVRLPGRRFYRLSSTIGEPVGFGGLEGDGEDRLLRSLVVAPASRGQRWGKAAATTLERLAGQDGARRLHVLTTTAAPFFELLGFHPAERETAPAAIAATAEFSALCPSAARYLIKDVRKSW